jgi:hypothetical protein
MATRSTPDVVQRVVSTYDPKGARAAAAAVRQFEKDQVSAAKVAQTAHGNILSSFLAMATGANTHLGSLSTSGGKAVSALKDIENSGLSVGSSLALGIAGGALAAGSALTAFAIKGVGDFVHLADETRSLELRMGGTAEQASRLIEAGDALGVSSETLTGAFFKLSKTIAGGGKDFEKYGIDVAKTAAGGNDLHGTLLNVIDAFNRTSDPVERDRIAFTAFGKSGSDLIPILAQGREGLLALEAGAKNVMTEDDINRAREYEMSQKRLEEANKHLAASMGRDLLPMFANYSAAMAQVTGGMDSTEKAYAKTQKGAEQYGHAVELLSVPVIGGILSTNSLGDALNHAHDGEAKVKQSADDAAASFAQQSKDAEELTKQMDLMYNAFMSGADADYALVRSKDSFTKSIDGVHTAQDALDKVRGNSATTAAQLAAANDAVTSAQDSEVTSAISVAKATRTAADEKAKQTGGTLAARDAIDLEIASLDASSTRMTGTSLVAIQTYIATLRSTPVSISTQMHLDTTAAMATIDKLTAAAAAAGYTGPHNFRAGGGPVVPNRVYTVGEAGPEQVTFPAAGFVHSSGTGPAPGPGGSGSPAGGGVHIDYYGRAEEPDIQKLAREVAWQMKTSG